MVCMRCGNSEGADAAFCSNCGAPLASQGMRSAGAVKPVPGSWSTAAVPTAAQASRAQYRDPYQEDYERAKAAGFPAPQKQPRPGQHSSASPGLSRAGSSTSGATGAGALLIVLGAVLLIVAIVLQFIRISAQGASLSASQVNGICQSVLGQFGQAFSSGLGDSTPQAVCSKAATIEDWKAITLWFGIALLFGGLSVIGRSLGWWTSSRSRTSTASYAASQQSPQAKLAAAERAEANAARLRAEAAQMQTQQPQMQAQQPQAPAHQPQTSDVPRTLLGFQRSDW